MKFQKIYIDNDLNEKTNLRFSQTLQKSLEVPVGKQVYNRTIYSKQHLIEIIFVRKPNIGTDLLQKWNTNFSVIKNNDKKENFIRSAKASSATKNSGVSLIPTIGNSFMYNETKSGNHGNNNVFVNLNGLIFYKLLMSL